MIEKMREIYYMQLPEKLEGCPTKETAYMFMCFVLHMLKENPRHLERGWITVAMIERESNKVINRVTMGRILGRFPEISKPKPNSRSKKGIKKWSKEYDVKEVYDLLLKWAVEPITLEQLKNPNTLKTIAFIGRNNNYSTFLYSTYRNVAMPEIPEVQEVELMFYYNRLWLKHYDKSYIHSYQLVRRLIDYADITLNDYGEDKPCLTITGSNNKEGYAIRSRQLLKDIFGEQHKLLNMDLYPKTIILSKLVAMVFHPEKDWNYVDGNPETNLVAHHKCFNPSCINPLHIQMMTEAEHNELHKTIKDNHPVTMPELSIQASVSCC